MAYVDIRHVKFVDIEELALLGELTGDEEVQIHQQYKTSLKNISKFFNPYGAGVVIAQPGNRDNPAWFLNKLILDANIVGPEVWGNSDVWVSKVQNGYIDVQSPTLTKTWSIWFAFLTTAADGTVTSQMFLSVKYQRVVTDADYLTFRPTGTEMIRCIEGSPHYISGMPGNGSWLLINWDTINDVPENSERNYTSQMARVSFSKYLPIGLKLDATPRPAYEPEVLKLIEDNTLRIVNPEINKRVLNVKGTEGLWTGTSTEYAALTKNEKVIYHLVN